MSFAIAFLSGPLQGYGAERLVLPGLRPSKRSS
jgi:hypothetical protein